MNNRFKEIRKAVGLTQAEMADKIGIKQSTVTAYETGNREVSDRTVKSICSVFSVSEDWLRYGEGEMFTKRSRNEIIADFMASMLKEENDSFKRRLIEAMACWSENDWETMARLAESLSGKK